MWKTGNCDDISFPKTVSWMFGQYFSLFKSPNIHFKETVYQERNIFPVHVQHFLMFLEMVNRSFKEEKESRAVNHITKNGECWTTNSPFWIKRQIYQPQITFSFLLASAAGSVLDGLFVKKRSISQSHEEERSSGKWKLLFLKKIMSVFFIRRSSLDSSTGY